MKSMNIDPLVRAALKVPDWRGRTLSRIASRFSADDSQGEAWFRYFLQLVDVDKPPKHDEPTMGYNVYDQPWVKFVSIKLRGKTECELLDYLGHKISSEAYHCLTRLGLGSYDSVHQLAMGEPYTIVLISGDEVVKNSHPLTTTGINAYAASLSYDSRQLRAGLVPRLCEVITAQWMAANDLGYVAVLHEPIPTPWGGMLLHITCDGKATHVGATVESPDCTSWPHGGAFAYVSQGIQVVRTV